MIAVQDFGGDLWPLYERVRQMAYTAFVFATQMGKCVPRRARYTTVQVPWPHDNGG